MPATPPAAAPPAPAPHRPARRFHPAGAGRPRERAPPPGTGTPRRRPAARAPVARAGCAARSTPRPSASRPRGPRSPRSPPLPSRRCARRAAGALPRARSAAGRPRRRSPARPRRRSAARRAPPRRPGSPRPARAERPRPGPRANPWPAPRRGAAALRPLRLRPAVVVYVVALPAPSGLFYHLLRSSRFNRLRPVIHAGSEPAARARSWKMNAWRTSSQSPTPASWSAK